jgi:DNA topoisomerase-6 subunit B
VRENAESMAERQRDISVSEFFAKNRHLLGFDNAARGLLTAVKEAVDNSLDACEEAEILPDLTIKLVQLAEDRFRITVEDNGPGIVKAQVPKVFGKLLYGSKFHRSRQSRGQQGIGISAAAMYGQLTTGQPTVIISKTAANQPANQYELQIDTKKNAPEKVREKVTFWERPHGTSVTIELEGAYKKGKRSVDEYVELTALANPHARLHYIPPKDEPVTIERVTERLPDPPKEIQPHPHGVELGVLYQILRDAPEDEIAEALSTHFSRVSRRVAEEICEKAGLNPESSPKRLQINDAERLFRAIPQVKILAPSTNCLSPIGEDLIRAALRRRVPDADFIDSCTRSPTVYRGNPFQVEVGMAFGGSLPGDELIEVYRFANRVPLQYQQSACAITKAVMTVPWKNYNISQSSGALPTAPMLVFVHLVSVWVPFTSESKEAIAAYDDILKEIRLGVMEVGRRLGIHLRKSRRRDDELKKRAYIDTYLPHVGIALQQILGLSDPQREEVTADLRVVLEKTRRMV